LNKSFSENALKKRIFSPTTFISFTIAALIISFLLTRFDIDLSQTWKRIYQADPQLYLAAAIVYYVGFIVRGYRWRLLVQNAHPEETKNPLPSLMFFGQSMFLGWFVNSISWFRMGDAYRAYLLSTKGQLSFSRTMGSVLAERVLDMLMVTGLLALAAGMLWTNKSENISGLLIIAIGLACLALIGLLGMTIIGKRLALRLPGPLRTIYLNFHEGTTKSFRRLPLIILASAMSWLFEVMRLFLIAYALNIEVSIPLLLFTALAASLLSTAPITPGGVGIVEFGMTGIFMIALSREDAISLTLLDRSIQYLSVIILGSLLFMVRALLTRQSDAANSKPDPQRKVPPSDDQN
tara:strand:- start:2192 stop:3241 length:1050 start_codon:yes stop_codon:yes gene_type:complete